MGDGEYSSLMMLDYSLRKVSIFSFIYFFSFFLSCNFVLKFFFFSFGFFLGEFEMGSSTLLSTLPYFLVSRMCLKFFLSDLSYLDLYLDLLRIEE